MDEALRTAVEALGGLKEVGHLLRPDIDPVSAGQWLSHCLSQGKRDKLASTQIDYIFDHAAQIGAHEALQGWCRGRGAGYTAAPTAPAVALAEAQQRALAAKQEAEQAAQDIQQLIDNPRLFATMRAAGLKVSEI